MNLYVSASAAVFQVERLLERIRSFRHGDFPPETQQIARLFETLALFIHSQLLTTSQAAPPRKSDEERIRRLSDVVHVLFYFLRYLDSTASKRTPPAIQAVLSSLAARCMPTAGRTPIVLIRPQWSYNLEFYHLSGVLRKLIVSDVFDPGDQLGILRDLGENISAAEYGREFLDRLWKRTSKGKPLEIAVLSFAGLDTDDVLQFPILAHELGHFIDYFGGNPRHQARLAEYYITSFSDLEAQLQPATFEEPLIERFLQIVNELIDTAFREILADLLAVRMHGLALFSALADLLDRLLVRNALEITDTGYLDIGYRLNLVHEAFRDLGVNSFFAKKRDADPDGEEIREAVVCYLEQWGSWFEAPGSLKHAGVWPQRLNEIAAETVKRALPTLVTLAKELIPKRKAAKIEETFYDRVLLLRDQLPPYTSNDGPESFAEIMAAAWAHRITTVEETDVAERRRKHLLTNRLVLKAIELSSESARFEASAVPAIPVMPQKAPRYGAVAEADLLARMALGRHERGRLMVVPPNPKAVKGASIDLRLGNWFKLPTRSRLPAVNLHTSRHEYLDSLIGQEAVFLPFDELLTIHPGDLVLGITLEFVSLPLDLMAFVEGRSLLGRAGLTVATAATVAPGFSGCIVLELSNVGVVPLQVTPTMDIAQLVLLTLTDDAPPYSGSSQGQIRP